MSPDALAAPPGALPPLRRAEFDAAFAHAQALQANPKLAEEVREYWRGFQRGLQRRHRGARVVSDREHDNRLTWVDSFDTNHAAAARGYRDACEGALGLEREDVARLRALLRTGGYSQRSAAEALDLSSRTMRYYCAGTQPVPRVVLYALEYLVQCLPAPQARPSSTPA